MEWALTLLFTVEYALRLACVDRPARYARSFFGIVDLLAILPTYVALAVPGAQELMVIWAVRVLRVFRIFRVMAEPSTSLPGRAGHVVVCEAGMIAPPVGINVRRSSCCAR